MGDSNDDLTLTSFRPISPEHSKTGFSLARFFQRKRHEERVEVRVDATNSQRPASPSTSPLSSPKPQNRAKSPEPFHRSWTSALGHRASAHSTPVPKRRASPGYRNVHAVLGRLNAAAGGRGQVSLDLCTCSVAMHGLGKLSESSNFSWLEPELIEFISTLLERNVPASGRNAQPVTSIRNFLC